MEAGAQWRDVVTRRQPGGAGYRETRLARTRAPSRAAPECHLNAREAQQLMTFAPDAFPEPLPCHPGGRTHLRPGPGTWQWP